MRLLIALCLSCLFSPLWAHNIVGDWQTIDDETHKPKAVVSFVEKNGVFVGTIKSLYPDAQNKCVGCKGAEKDQAILNMQVVKNLKADDDNHYSGGHIFDPASGKTYKCQAEVIENGKKLKLRGFIGVSLIGRTQVWTRL